MTAPLVSETRRITRQALALTPTPVGTATHGPIPHGEIVNALIETLGLRKIGVTAEVYAVGV